MPLSIRDAGAWKGVNRLHIRDGGAWKEVKGLWIRDGGAWKQAFSAEIFDFSAAQNTGACPFFRVNLTWQGGLGVTKTLQHSTSGPSGPWTTLSDTIGGSETSFADPTSYSEDQQVWYQIKRNVSPENWIADNVTLGPCPG